MLGRAFTSCPPLCATKNSAAFGDYFRPCSYPVLIPGVYKILPKASLFRPLIHDLSFAKKSAKCFLIQSLQQERVFLLSLFKQKIVYLNCDKNHHLKCTKENANFGQFWAILSRTYELFGDKYKVWELRALEHVESTRMLVGGWGSVWSHQLMGGAATALAGN